ncbi:RES family NAD+ phosphorylase [Thiohalocapsa sp. ML1]|jgi:hypothetical protein|uniref:RES family NAD+ phosphorylase n=1 Tax=Thiohalocapsa sp. ML1 TaxID=1431688 RepID=UPI00073241B8|nr:RES family NAD+ phosphorylase [Thiohalocapsa sp. ML1]
MSLPLPPRGGHGKLRVVSVPAGQAWYRIVHARYASALHFSSGPAGRWNDAQADFGVLYVADAPGTAFAETFGHGLSGQLEPAADKFVTVQELSERRLYRITATRALQLALFLGPGLAALNLDGHLLTTLDYRAPQAWSRWVHGAPAALDGIRYASRTLPGQENAALFERCGTALQEQALGTLADWRSEGGELEMLEILDAQGWGLI